jgi:hypothetical protein
VTASPPVDSPASALRRRLLIADVIGLLAFTLLGLRMHMVGGTVPAILRTVVPLWVAWIAVGLWRGAYRAPSLSTLAQTWILAVPIALVARHVFLGRAFGSGFLIFVAVALVMTMVCVVVARLIIARAVWTKR